MSDPFAALLAKQPAAEVSEEDADPFNSLLRKGKPAPAPAPATQPAGGIPVDTRYTAPPKAEQDPSTLGKLVRGKGVLETTADVGDIVVGGFPATVLGTIGEVTQRASALVDGRGYREGAKAGAEFSRAMGERFGRPIFDNLVAAGLLDPKSRSVPMQAMDKIGGWLENAATIVEHDTGGKISKEDYLASVNGFMAAMGVKGVQAATAKALAARGSASQKSAWDTALERFEAEEQLARASEAEGMAARTTTPVADAAKARLLRPEEPAAGGRTREQARKDAKAAFSTPEAGEQAGLIDRQAAYREELAAQEAAMRNRFPPSGERTGLREAQPIDVKNPLMDRTPDGQLFPVEDPLQTSRGTRLAPDAPLSETHRLEVPQASALDSGLLKVKENRLFDMTMEERLAVKNSAKITDPKIITAAAVGATGLGLAMAYGPSAEEAAMAIGAGVLLRRGGVGETMRELAARPDATPLGAMLEASAYTTSTLEKLADASPGKFEFKKTAVEQLLKREGVTKHERDLMTAALSQAPGDTITAKQLMVGMRVAAQDFELTAKTTDLHGEYGLESIGRARVDEHGFAIPAAEQAVSRVYESPLELGIKNHYQNPKYFAHTRSFVEDGVRHVVELQSDLGQKIGKVLPPERIAALEEEGRALSRRIKELDDPVNGRQVLPELQELRQQRQKIVDTISASFEAADAAPVAPMLKDWHKRLVREELADAARNLEGSVRFATADTVAKVEGWPRLNADGVDVNLARELGVADPAATSGTTRFRPEHQGIYDRYQKDVEKFLRQLGAQPITDSAGHTWLEVPLGEQQKALPGGGARTQIGGVDPALLKGAAAVGGTAALAWTLSSPKEKHRHALWTGALVGLGLYAKSRNPTIAKLASDFAKGTQMMFGNLSTDKAMTPAILRRLGNFEMDVQVAGHTAVRKIAPFVEQLDAIPAGLRPLIDTALANGKLPEIKAALGRYGTPELLKALDQTRALLNDLGEQAQEVKLLKELRPDYFPRIVKDMEGLLKALGKDYGTDLQIALKQAETRAGGLDEVGRSELINRFLEKHTRQAPGSGKAGFLKRRTIDNVMIDLAPFYVEPTQALPLYVGGMVRAIEKAKFFGKDLIVDPESGRPNLAASIGAVVARELKAGSITPETYERLEGLLRSRFGPGEQSPHRALQSLSQFTNIALLANAFSAAMNLADIGGIAAQQGPLAVIKALQKKLTGKASLTATDVGMAEAIGAEFIYGTRDPIKMRVPLTEHQVHVSMSKAIDKTFRLAGFRAADIVMKEVHLNAAIEKYQKLSRTAAGEKRIVRQYGAYFTSDMGQLLSDLRAGQKTRLTTELAFRELSDAQPTTRIEMPQLYLNHPNFRFAFALKSFMVKQLNLIKKRGIDELLRGNVKEGTGFLLRYALFAGSAGASMNWIVQSLLGRDEDLDWGSIPLHAMKNFGLSQYVLEKMRQGKGKEAIASAFAPPLDPILNIASGDPEGVRHVPLAGRLVYDRAMDGAEKANAAKKLAEKKKKRDAERTPSERRELERRALERRQRLLQEN